MDLVIYVNGVWHPKDFVVSMGSLFGETKLKNKVIFIIRKGTKRAITNCIKNFSRDKIARIIKDFDEEKKNITGPVIVIRYPILFYLEWENKLLKAMKRLGKNNNYVPSFVNQLGEQISILNNVYPDNLLFDLDYRRDAMKKKNIDYFNRLCDLQYKKIKRPSNWIILYPDNNLKERPTICVLSCAVAKLKR